MTITIHAIARQSARLGDGIVLSVTGLQNLLKYEAIRGASFNFTLDRFVAPRTLWPAMRLSILATGYSLDEDAQLSIWVADDLARAAALEAAAARRADEFHDLLAARGLSLRAYQREGIAWLTSRRVGLLTDEMGLGKTVQALCAMPHGQASIVVSPASLRPYWRDEVRRWRSDLTPVVLEGRGNFHFPLLNEVVIVSDATLPPAPKSADPPLPAPPICVSLFADEAHAYKGDSQRTERLSSLCERVRRGGGSTIGMTGTPLLNHPDELYTLARVFGCQKLAWANKPAFVRAFAIRETPYGTTYGEPKPEARQGLARISLRRTRAEVLPELPGKVYKFIPVTLPRALSKRCDKVYEKLTPQLDEWEWHDKMPDFSRFSEVSSDLALLKLDAAEEWVVQHEAAEEPVVVFSGHIEGVNRIAQRPGWARITGDDKPEDRNDRANAFQRGEYRGLAGSIQAMGTGFTLTRAHNMLFIDRMYTNGLNDQAADRLDRLGQTEKVVVSVLVADHPLEQRVEAILTKKRALTDATV